MKLDKRLLYLHEGEEVIPLADNSKAHFICWVEWRYYEKE